MDILGQTLALKPGEFILDGPILPFSWYDALMPLNGDLTAFTSIMILCCCTAALIGMVKR